MDSKYKTWFKNYKELINLRKFDEALMHLSDGVHIAFSSPQLYHVYIESLKIPREYFNNLSAKIIFGWFCFANGDYVNLDWIMQTINEIDLKDSEDSSSFYALKAMITFSKSKDEGLKYAKLAIDILSKDNSSVIMGNALMTYARLLTNLKSYRKGAHYFLEAYNVFKKSQCSFLAISCFVNECLNLYSLGEYKKVISQAHNVLELGTSLHHETSDFMKLVKLPLGMCYYELNKMTIAEKAFDEVLQALDNLNLPHLHGIIEIYLFKIYLFNHENEKIIRLIDYLEDLFKNLHNVMIKDLLTVFKIRLALLKSDEIKEEWIEELEMAFHLKEDELLFFILETLIQLRIMNKSQIITIDFLLSFLDKLRYEGHVPNLQAVLLYLSELYFNNDDVEKAKLFVREAYSIYKDYGMKVKFLENDLTCLALLKNINKEFYQIISNGHKPNVPQQPMLDQLTTRELEVLRLIAQGKTNKDISNILYISIGTTKWHINNIFSKLNVNKRFEALKEAKKLKIIK